MTTWIMASKRRNRKRQSLHVGRNGRPTRFAQHLPILGGVGILLLIAGLAGWLTFQRAKEHYAKFGHVYIPHNELVILVMVLVACAIVVVFSMIGRKKNK